MFANSVVFIFGALSNNFINLLSSMIYKKPCIGLQVS